jgi:hypothetical protein
MTGTLVAGVLAAASALVVLGLLLVVLPSPSDCPAAGGPGAGGPAASIGLGPPGTGQLVGATEYGGPGDPRSGATGARGDNLDQHPDSYAELGGLTWQTATAMGGLAYMTPLRISWASHSAIAYKRDFGLGGGPVGGLPRVIDLWWQLADRLGMPYQHGQWSGAVRVERPPAGGAGNLIGQTPAQADTLVPPSTAGQDAAACAPGNVEGVPLTAGHRAKLLPSGLAAAPQSAPLAVKQIIAAGNQIVGRPYGYGASHGLPLSAVGQAYDCSSSVEHLLYGARLLPVTYGGASGELESFGQPGPGQWVTVFASSAHVFMYVAGMRWDTYDAAGAGDGSAGIGWHPLIRGADGFVARHPAGL